MDRCDMKYVAARDNRLSQLVSEFHIEDEGYLDLLSLIGITEPALITSLQTAREKVHDKTTDSELDTIVISTLVNVLADTSSDGMAAIEAIGILEKIGYPVKNDVDAFMESMLGETEDDERIHETLKLVLRPKLITLLMDIYWRQELGEKCESPIELKLYRQLVHSKLDKGIELQYDKIAEVNTIPDFTYPDKKIAIYCDGHKYHERTKKQARRDRSQDRKLQSLGWTVLRYTGSEIYNNVEKCVEEIRSFLKTTKQ